MTVATAPRTALKIMLILGGVVLLAVGAVIAAYWAVALLISGLFSPFYIDLGGPTFFRNLATPFAWMVGGAVMAFTGLGLMLAAFNLRSSPQEGAND